MDRRISELLKKQKRPSLNSLQLPFTPREAAVLVVLSPSDEEDSVILTKRTHEVAHHKGQICFPGGVYDEEDESLWQTALRETWEEIGIEPNLISFIGELGQVITPTGFRITPFLGRLTQPVPWKTNPQEIDAIFKVPLSHLLLSENIQFTRRQLYGMEYQDPVIFFQNHEIWGATGRIIVDFIEVWRSVA